MSSSQEQIKTERLLQELQVYRIELELQNEELRLAHSRLEDAASQYSDLYDFAPVGYFTFSPRGSITRSNLAGARLLGLDRGSLPGRCFADFVAQEDRAAFLALLRGVFGGEDGHTCELNLLVSSLPQTVSIEGLRSADGLECRAVIMDISSRKEAERERSTLQSQLSQAQKMESIGQLAGGVAHDFNNKLSVIMGYAELAMGQLEAGSLALNYLTGIRKAALQSAGLTRQLLAFARKQTVAPVVLDLDAAVDGMLPMLRHICDEGVELVWTPGAGDWRVKMDPVQVDQLLTNLCMNGWDAMDAKGTLTVTTAAHGSGALACGGHGGLPLVDHVVLSVTDTGAGMSADVLDKLFEPFFTTKSAGQGTGLGLAMVYGIVKQNHGTIEVISEKGKGSTFHVCLPRYAGLSEAAVAKTEAFLTRGKERILLVEDELVILRMTTHMLEGLGYEVLPASGHQEAMRLLGSGAVCQLLLTDVVMPEMNGRELAKMVLACRPGLKILYMSGYPAEIIVTQGILDEDVNFLAKPFSVQDLSGAVRAALVRA